MNVDVAVTHPDLGRPNAGNWEGGTTVGGRRRHHYPNVGWRDAGPDNPHRFARPEGTRPMSRRTIRRVLTTTAVAVALIAAIALLHELGAPLVLSAIVSVLVLHAIVNRFVWSAERRRLRQIALATADLTHRHARQINAITTNLEPAAYGGEVAVLRDTSRELHIVARSLELAATEPAR